jgi:hypothetical protein
MPWARSDSMPRTKSISFSYTNRKGDTYYLHVRRTKTGKTRYVFARSIGNDPVDVIPNGYQVTESINGQVSLARTQQRVISEAEEETVRSSLKNLNLTLHHVKVKGNAILVHEPLRSTHLLDDLRPFMRHESGGEMQAWVRRGNYAPVLRFVLDDEGSRTFHVERMTYRGDCGWSWSLGSGKIEHLVEKYLPHLGKESFFDLL